MVKVHIVREIMDANPRNGFARSETIAYQRQLCAFSLHALVAIHASLRRRHRGVRSPLYGVVAISAVKTEFARMNLMAKRYGLLRGVSDVRRLR
jgi:hypothetical protein